VFQLAQRHGSSVQGKQQTLDALTPVLGQIRKEAARDLTVRYVADLVGVSTESILKSIKPQGKPTSPDELPPKFGPKQGRQERRCLILLLRSSDLIDKWREQLWPDRFSEFAYQELIAALRRVGNEEARQLSPDQVIEMFPEHQQVVRSLLLQESYYIQGVTDNELESEYQVAKLLYTIGRELLPEIRRMQGTDREQQVVEQYMKFSLPMATERNRFRRPHAIRQDRLQILATANAKFREAKLESRLASGGIEAISEALELLIQMCKRTIPPGAGKVRIVREAEEFGETMMREITGHMATVEEMRP
jgi:hypothetical protein